MVREALAAAMLPRTVTPLTYSAVVSAHSRGPIRLLRTGEVERASLPNKSYVAKESSDSFQV